ncbi:hypothetical protein V9T40_003084 [Parthenolecanium corni]|uniref:G-protein coupled receptors family 1 profile domain-containing protein n=1 Tax=Parthenolecanium corni TaxID=536013 RepID=A0AAN9TUN8_9HEMI
MTTLDTLEDNITSKRISSEDIWGPVRSHLVIVYALTVIYGFIFIFGFFGNIITCVVVIRNKYMHTVTNFYLLSLAVSDLLLLVSGLPMEMYQIWFRYPYIFGETFCILQGLAAETSANATVLTITAFTIERYIAICYPFISRNAMKLKRAVRYIILIWVVSFIFAIPQAIKRGLVYAKDEADNLIQELSICTVKNDLIPHTFGISMMLFFIIPMTIITILYILIGLKLRRPKVQNPDKRDQILILTTAGEITQQHEDHDDLSPYIIHNQSTKRVVKMLDLIAPSTDEDFKVQI